MLTSKENDLIQLQLVNSKSKGQSLAPGATMMTFANGTMKVPNFVITNVKTLQNAKGNSSNETILPGSSLKKILPKVNQSTLTPVKSKYQNIIISSKIQNSSAISNVSNVYVKKEIGSTPTSPESPQWLKTPLKKYTAKKKLPLDLDSKTQPVDEEHAYVSKYQSPIITMKKLEIQQSKGNKTSKVADRTCRLCLQFRDQLTPLICGNRAKPELNIFLKECCSIEVKMEDPMPQAICNECIAKLQSAWDFRNLCQKSDNELRKFFKVPLVNYSRPREDNYAEKIEKGIQVESYDRYKRKEIRETTKKAIKEEIEEPEQPEEEHLEYPEIEEQEQHLEDPETRELIETLEGDDTEMKVDYDEVANEDKEENAVTYFLESFAQEISNNAENSEEEQPVELKEDITSDTQEQPVITVVPKKRVIRRKRKTNEEKPKYLCHMCPRVFTSKAFLERHSNFHLQEKNFTCETCNKVFKNDDKLQAHLRIHDKTKRFECEVCGLKYVYEYLLNSHLRLHGRGKPLSTEKHFLCEVCSKTFASQSGLKHHQKLHMDLKPYKCRFCEKTFTMPIYRKKHEFRHSETRQFKCHLCPATYHSTNGLTNHLLLHTGEAHYHCKTCGKSFRRRKYLNEHMFTHTGEKPYICKMCGIGYGNSGSLFAHQKRCRAQFAEEATKDVVEEIVVTEGLVEEFLADEEQIM